MKAKSHRQLTRLALELYLQKGAGTSFGRAISEKKYRRALLCGTAREDDPTARRLLNWHFFPANDLLRQGERQLPAGLTLRPTSLWVLQKRQEALQRRLEKGPDRRLFWALGRVLHHLQDMSTPSHVVPVYHGVTVSDPFEAYLVNNWAMIYDRVKDTVSKETSVAAMVADHAEIYRRGAVHTLTALESGNGLFPLPGPDGRPVEATAFWLPWELAPALAGVPLKVKGFGRFGPLGQAWPEKKTVATAETLENPSIFLLIAVFFVAAAVRDTLAAFAHFDAELTSKMAGNP